MNNAKYAGHRIGSACGFARDYHKECALAHVHGGCVTVLFPWQALTQPLSWYDVDSPKYLVGPREVEKEKKQKNKKLD